ncbi:MAG: c-type cytochrome [Acidobacteriota bacterium]|nr:c-type cytochrome [Acidobacteriota bacterium]
MRVQVLRVLTAVLVLATVALAGDDAAPDPAVTSESWLTHLQRPFSETSMGKTWALGPSASLPEEAKSQWHPALSPTIATSPVTLKGADLYRFNCEGCHGEAGLGAPPEIHSVINPVRATSAALVMKRMKDSGMEISAANASQMAKEAKDALLLRFQKGGEAMPPFAHLQPPEERLVLSYLNELAGVSGASAAHDALVESPARVGELIVKSTCHICHDATGANPDPKQILQGAIPPLSTLTHRTNEAEFIRKVTHGSPVLMGDPASPERGRMPVFYYLSENEAADVYLYLMVYPPRASARQDVVAAGNSDSRDTAVVAATTYDFPMPPSSPPPAPQTSQVDGALLSEIAALVSVVGALLFGGVAITAWELRRLSICSKSQRIAEQGTASAAQALVLIQKRSKENRLYDRNAWERSTILSVSHS